MQITGNLKTSMYTVFEKFNDLYNFLRGEACEGGNWSDIVGESYLKYADVDLRRLLDNVQNMVTSLEKIECELNSINEGADRSGLDGIKAEVKANNEQSKCVDKRN